MVRWLERNGYDVAYCGNIDTHRQASVLQNRKVFISSGHDEYWSGATGECRGGSASGPAPHLHDR